MCMDGPGSSIIRHLWTEQLLVLRHGCCVVLHLHGTHYSIQPIVLLAG